MHQALRYALQEGLYFTLRGMTSCHVCMREMPGAHGLPRLAAESGIQCMRREQCTMADPMPPSFWLHSFRLPGIRVLPFPTPTCQRVPCSSEHGSAHPAHGAP